jgi:alpha-ribazole phosphatase
VGWRDIPADLSDTAALARLDGFLPTTAILVSSDLRRSISTADALSTPRPRLPHKADLREFNFGQWDGLDFNEVSERWPDLSRKYWEKPGSVAPPDGESWFDAAARVDRTVKSLVSDHPDCDIIAVAHFGVILTQFQIAAGLTPYQALAQKIDNLSVTCLVHDKGVWSVDCVNHIA